MTNYQASKEYPKAFKRNHIVASEIKDKDDSTKPFRIILHRYMGDLVIHTQTMDDDGLHCGDYFRDNADDYERAFQEYCARCRTHGVRPIAE